VPLGELAGRGASSSESALLPELYEPDPELLEPEPLEDAALPWLEDEPDEEPDEAERSRLFTRLRTTWVRCSTIVSTDGPAATCCDALAGWGFERRPDARAAIATSPAIVAAAKVFRVIESPPQGVLQIGLTTPWLGGTQGIGKRSPRTVQALAKLWQRSACAGDLWA
jgi:hypothetical protein